MYTSTCSDIAMEEQKGAMTFSTTFKNVPKVGDSIRQKSWKIQNMGLYVGIHGMHRTMAKTNTRRTESRHAIRDDSKSIRVSLRILY